jgi:plasmid stabilization system protein ParE
VTKLIWSPQALRDLETIRDYIAADSPRYAALVVERIVVGADAAS